MRLSKFECNRLSSTDLKKDIQSFVHFLFLSLSFVSAWGVFFSVWARSPLYTSLDSGVEIIKNKKALTVLGSRSGEGYFSRDGLWMTFQSERDDSNPFYQIYLMNLKTGKTQRVSNGEGQTTCSWIHPDQETVLFSSTHLDLLWKDKAQREWDRRKSLQKSKYSWDYDESYDIFSWNKRSQKYTRLTHERGYDAEASYSPDGKWIVFASNRLAYQENIHMSEDEKKIFSQDPSYMIDLYRMKADGSEVQRLTQERGYNGGPFYSFDGQKITFRRFNSTGQTAEIYVMNADGSEQKKITDTKSMSWAPFFHPSGKYLVFTSNLLGFSNFELFIVDVEGKNIPVRVSYIDGFDGLPVFTPDGRHISWTHQNEKGESQIWMADWDDDLAQDLLHIHNEKPQPKVYQPQIRISDLQRTLRYLSSPQMQGRPTGSEAEKIYSKTLVDLFKGWGIESFTQEFEFVSSVKLGDNNELMLLPRNQSVGSSKGISTGSANGSKNKQVTIEELKLGQDFVPFSFSKSGSFASAPIAFVGYGIAAPVSPHQPAYDSYYGLDVKGRWVMALKDIPDGISDERKVFLNTYSRPYHKAMAAEMAQAVGLLIVQPPLDKARGSMREHLESSSPHEEIAQRAIETQRRDESPKEGLLKYDGGAEARIPVISISYELAQILLAETGRTLPQWTEVLSKGELQGALLKNEIQLAAKVDLKFQKSKGINTFGFIPAKNHSTPSQYQTKTLVIGAHGDHLGHGEFGNSLAKNEEKGKVHPGADDNASGVSAIVELAHALKQKSNLSPNTVKHNILFAIWSGEELGTLGSSHFFKNWSSIENQIQKGKSKSKFKKENIFAYLNLDMVGRYRDTLMIQGVQSAKEWKSILEPLSVLSTLSLSFQNDPYQPTDSLSFYLNEVPSITFFTGSHEQYHSPRDESYLINWKGLLKVTEFVQDVALNLLHSNTNPLHYQKVEGGRDLQRTRSFRIYLGTIPDYTQDGIKGVKISGTSKDSPAHLAGLQSGDVIVELGGTKIENLYDYVYKLQTMKANQSIDMKILRSQLDSNEKSSITLKITPSLKE